MRAYRRGIKRGKYVRKGQVIGYVGSTGMSTGSHLHFGLYRGSRAINPFSVIKVTKSRLTGKTKKEFLKYVENYKKEFELALTKMPKPRKWESFEYVVNLDTKRLQSVSK